MTYTITGNGNITFGTGEIAAATIGTVTSGGRKKAGEQLELKDVNGNTFVVIFFDDKDECEIEAILDADYTPPARGDFIDLCALTDLIVKDWDLKWANTKEKGITIRATKYVNITN